MTHPSIRLRGVSKRYVKYADTPTLVGRAMQLRRRSRRSELWALRDVDIDVPKGACVGVIGRNGSGKSTLLRLIAGVTAPTGGSVTVHGRVAPLIAVGVGFHPELTGRENVYVSSAILGATAAETDAHFDEIVAFADIGDFLDTPVKFYSSGMFVRLGFAVAVAIRPDVLLVDEVLAVGDIGFQQRCFRRIEEMRESGTTILLVTHNLSAVSRLCDQTIVVHDGEIRFDGPTAQAIACYHRLLGGEDGDGDGGAMAVTRSMIVDASGAPVEALSTGDAFAVEVDARCAEDVVDPVLSIHVLNDEGVVAFSRTSEWDRRSTLRAGDTLRCRIRMRATLAPGSYDVLVGAADQAGRLVLPNASVGGFFVAGADRVKGIADLDAEFDLDLG